MPPKTNVETNIVFEPVPGSASELAIDTRCHHTLYDGTRGAMKSATQLMRYRRRVGLGYGKFWRGVIFDKEFKNLGDLVAQSKKFFGAFNDGAKFLESGSDYKWVWPTGEELLFRHIKKDSDYLGFHGWELPFVGYNELTKWPTSSLYDKLMSTNRSSFIPEKHTPKVKTKTGWKYATPDGKPLPPIPLEVFSTTNPSGPGHNWVKKRFIDCAPCGEVVETIVNVFDPKTQKDIEVVRTQVRIFGSYRENIYLDPIYIANLNILTENDENLRRAWLFGDWNITAGGALDDLWDNRIHILPRFNIPDNWRVDRSFDWGQSKPFSVCWWAEANGEETVLPDGSTFCPVRGSLIQIAEWYGSKEIGTNKGINLGASDVADGIKNKEIELMAQGWILKQPVPGPADNAIAGGNDPQDDSTEKKMAKKGIRWTKSDKAKGSRVDGLTMVREMMANAKKKEGPAIYFMNNCKASIEILPPLPRDDDNLDDVDSDAEDHCFSGSTLIKTSNGDIKISNLVGTNGYVFTENGELTKYHSVRKTRVCSDVIKLKFNDGSFVICTPDHKFLTTHGWERASCLFDTKSYIITDRIRITKFMRFLWKLQSFRIQFKSLTVNAFTGAISIFNIKV